MSSIASDLPETLRERRRIGPDETFRFGCHPGVPCFNHCCQDVNILLTPLDVLRLARRLAMTTGDFLDRYTVLPITKDLHLPVVLLRMNEEDGKRCHFVGPGGCTVYEDRPWACRMYPVAMALPPARAGVEPEPMYFLFEDDFCHGHRETGEWTVDSWRADQGVPAREAIEAGFQELVAHPWFIGGRQLDPKRVEMFHMACYDLDRFRTFIFESTFLQRFELDDDLVGRLRSDDEALLAFAFRWCRFALFAEPTMKSRAEATTSGRRS